MTRSDPSSLKREAAARALDFVCSGMTLGLGTGSTAEAFLELLGPKVQAGLDVVGVPTSERTAQKARSLGIPLLELDAAAPLEMTVDGADEADRGLKPIKGRGGARAAGGGRGAAGGAAKGAGAVGRAVRRAVWLRRGGGRRAADNASGGGETAAAKERRWISD